MYIFINNIYIYTHIILIFWNRLKQRTIWNEQFILNNENKNNEKKKNFKYSA